MAAAPGHDAGNASDDSSVARGGAGDTSAADSGERSLLIVLLTFVAAGRRGLVG
jgi:hypothetical protein